MDVIKQNTHTQIIKSVIVIFLGSVMLAISAKVKIPFYPVPMTMQTFMVLFLGVCFGYKIAISTVGLYLIEGVLGLPVFSNSPERGVGLVYFTGPTMGYLIGFIFASFLASFVKIKDNYFIIERDEFYILRSKEYITIKNNQAAELEPFKDSFGNFRVHYAGFFDPGFGNNKYRS